MLTEGKGEDEEEQAKEKESKEEEVPLKKKGKVIITKFVVFARRTSKKKSGK